MKKLTVEEMEFLLKKTQNGESFFNWLVDKYGKFAYISHLEQKGNVISYTLDHFKFKAISNENSTEIHYYNVNNKSWDYVCNISC